MKCAEKHLCLPSSLHYHLSWGTVVGRSLARFLSLQESTIPSSLLQAPGFIRLHLCFQLCALLLRGKKNNSTTLTLKDRLKNGDASTRKRSRQKHIHHLFVCCIDSNGLFAASVPNPPCLATRQRLACFAVLSPLL